MSELDLERGDEELADRISKLKEEAPKKTPAKPAAKRAPSSSTGRARRPSAGQQLEAEIANRLGRTFDRIADTLSARGDEELADVIREDKEGMTIGIVSLTRSVKPLRSPLIMVLNLIEPVLAFGRIGRILVGRWADRRARLAEERQAEHNGRVESAQQYAEGFAQ